MDESTRRLRYEIFQFLLQQCRPPTVEELANKTNDTTDHVNELLQRLGDLHHIKLYDDNIHSPTPIAMAHPFSHLPTPYVVCQGTKSWWANCAWCAFGLAAMLSNDDQVSVNVLDPASGQPWSFTVTGDLVVASTTPSSRRTASGSADDCCVVFSVPLLQWWNDVRFACGTIQLCGSREEARAWFSDRGFHEGEIMDLGTLWKLSKAWYGNKHHYGYERKSPDEVKKLFEELGMVSGFWRT